MFIGQVAIGKLEDGCETDENNERLEAISTYRGSCSVLIPLFIIIFMTSYATIAS